MDNTSHTESNNCQIEETLPDGNKNHSPDALIDQLLSQPLVRQILDGIQDIIGIQLPDHRIVAYNKAGYDFLRKTPEEVQGKTCFELIGRMSPCVPCTTTAALQTGKPSQAERYFPEINKYVQVRCVPVFDSRGEISFFVEQLSDITARKTADQQLAGQTARYRALIEDSQFGFMVVHAGRISYVNTHITRLCGIEKQALAGNTIDTFLSFVHKEDREQVRESLLSCQNEFSTSRRIMCTITGADSTVHAIEMHLSRMLFEGRPACQCFLLDITDKDGPERAIWHSQAKYLRIFNNLQDVYYETDMDGTILEISPSIETVSHYSRNSLIGRNVNEFYDVPENRNTLLEEIKQAGRLDDYEIIFIDADDSKVDCAISCILTTDPLDGKPRLVGSLRVITDRKKLERRLAQLVKEKETLIREVHHRVKNNMQVITGLLYLQGEQAHNPKYEKLLNESISRIEAMSMVHELLHKTDGSNEVDMAKYLKNLVDGIRKLYRGNDTGISFSIHVHGITLLMEQAITCGLIVSELVSNAFKHGFNNIETGTIAIALSTYGEDRMKLSISHTGKGFDPDFEWRNSTSLGLKLAVMLTEQQLGGTLELTSPKHSEFTLIFAR